ncbi:hypothetical protein [Paenibacillus arenosi]|uniref:DUF3829 domain-containing protein n=1 Tax=Paenibacillus arenosi TaxID=2774142 RepID=A0ABR9B5D5_9BACL|nr:hypothetical protein [Paenibacillus arenosi]MBD8501218.1 hypothetical protein [Paenibacillus arenosi]
MNIVNEQSKWSKKTARIAIIIGASFVALSLITGCGNDKLTVKQPPAANETGTAANPAEQPTGSEEQNPAKQFELAITEVKEAHEAIELFDKHISKADKKAADSMFLRLEQFYTEQLPSINANLTTIMSQADMQKYIEHGIFNIEKAKQDSAYKEWLLNQEKGKLIWDWADDVFLKVDYAALHKDYANYISADLSSYLAIQANESAEKLMSDGALKITRDELAKRLIDVEQYVTGYPNAQKKAAMLDLYSQYIHEYIHGYRYNAIADETHNDTMKLLPEVKANYEKLVQQHPTSKTAQIVSDYLVVINENKDVIYNQGEPGGSIRGDIKPTIKKFWDQLDVQVNQLFGQ